MLHVSYSLVPYYGDDVFEFFPSPSELPGYPYVAGWAGMFDKYLDLAKEGQGKEEATKIRALFDGLY
jgi:hypothetical protein